MEYVVKEIKDNIGVDKGNSSYCTFDVLVEYDGVKKWIAIQHTDFLVWAMLDSKKLELYIENRNFKNWDEAIEDLTSLNYDWNKEMARYMDKHYPKKVFLILPQYNADHLNLFDGEDDE